MSTTTCLIVQPIHPCGREILAAAGIASRRSSAYDMSTVAREIVDCSAVITRSAGLSAKPIAAARRLRVIGVHGTGTDPVDIPSATARGIAVVNTPFANVQSVAEHALALLFAAGKAIVPGDQAARAGDFDFKYRTRFVEFSGLIFGVVGFGRIGQATAQLAAALGMRTLAFSPSQPDAAFSALSTERARSLDDLLSRSDAVSLHLPLTQATRNLIGEREFGLMKKTAVLINTGRGGVVSEAALIDALRHGTIAGAGLDVFASERMPAGYELLQLSNVVLTPHVAGSTEQSLERAARTVASEIIAVLEGRRPTHLVNPEVWTDRAWSRSP